MITPKRIRPSIPLQFNDGSCVFCQSLRLQPILQIREAYISMSPRAPSVRSNSRRGQRSPDMDIENVASKLERNPMKPNRRTVAGPKSKVAEKEPSGPSSLTFADLQKVYKDGYLEVDPMKAKILLGKLYAWGPKPQPQTLVEACKELRIELEDLTSLARLLMRSKSKVDFRQGQVLLACATKAGCVSAAVFAAKTAHRQKQLDHPNMLIPLTLLHKTAIKGANGPAMVMQAKVYEANGKREAALEMYRMATKIETITPVAEETYEITKKADPRGEFYDLDTCSAWRGIGNLLIDSNSPLFDFEGGRAAYEKAALEYDDPKAYDLLAVWERAENPDYTMKWIEYRLKAAASGHIESCYQLGLMYAMPYENVCGLKHSSVRDHMLSSPIMGGRWIRYRRFVQSMSSIRRKFGFGFQPGVPVDQSWVRDRSTWALHWLTIASDAGHFAALCISTEHLWDLGMYDEALQSMWRIQQADPNSLGTWSYLPAVMAKLFKMWQKSRAWVKVRHSPQLKEHLDKLSGWSD